MATALILNIASDRLIFSSQFSLTIATYVIKILISPSISNRLFPIILDCCHGPALNRNRGGEEGEGEEGEGGGGQWHEAYQRTMLINQTSTSCTLLSNATELRPGCHTLVLLFKSCCRFITFKIVG